MKTYALIRLGVIYLSLPALLIYLYQQNFFLIPHVHNIQALLFSLIFLLAGFVLLAQAWRKALQLYGEDCDLSLALRSVGITVFAKYIPGKIWGAMGQAAYILESGRRHLPQVLTASLDYQVLVLWSGLAVGGLLLARLDWPLSASILYITLVLLVFLFLLIPRRWVLLEKLLPRNIRNKIRHEDYQSAVGIMPIALAVWVLWSVSFYLLIAGLTEGFVTIWSGLAFALAGSLSILSPITPGGLGVREGLLTLVLIMLGIGSENAVTLSVVSRAWFLLGELYMFIQAILISRVRNKRIISDE